MEKIFKFSIEDSLMQKIREVSIFYKLPIEKVISFSVNFMYLSSKVPKYKIAFIDENNEIVKPVNLEDL